MTKIPLQYGRPHYYRRKHDGVYCVDAILSMGDIGLVSAYDIQSAIDHNLPWLNPLKWVNVKVFSTGETGKQAAIAFVAKVHSLGSIWAALQSPEQSVSLQTDAMAIGASG